MAWFGRSDNNDPRVARLRDGYDEFHQLAFPRFHNNAVLDDLATDMAAYDGFVAGLVSTFVNTGKVNKNFLNIDEQYQQRLAEYIAQNPQSATEAKRLGSYLEKQNKLLRLLIDIVNTKYDSDNLMCSGGGAGDLESG